MGGHRGVPARPRSGGEAPAALLPPAPEDRPSRAGPAAGPEAVGPGALPLLWLVGPLHDDVPWWCSRSERPDGVGSIGPRRRRFSPRIATSPAPAPRNRSESNRVARNIAHRRALGGCGDLGADEEEEHGSGAGERVCRRQPRFHLAPRPGRAPLLRQRIGLRPLVRAASSRLRPRLRPLPDRARARTSLGLAPLPRAAAGGPGQVGLPLPGSGPGRTGPRAGAGGG